MNRKNIKTIHGVPEDLIEEILPRLPVKSLLRFRCVSKSWHSLIGSEQFIKTHFQNSTKNTSLAHHRVIFHSNGDGLKQCSLRSLLNEPSIDPSSLIDNLPNNQPKKVSVVGCYNGLFCILKHPRRFFLWNPATRISIELPRIHEAEVIPKYGFGWDETSGAYKVFTLVGPNYKRRIGKVGKVYSWRTNTWKTVERGTLLWRGTGQFVGGKIHWAKIDGHDIESFDLETEKFGTVEIPFDREDWFYLWLGEIGGCLCVVCDDKQLGVDVWVMKEYGVKESWVNILTIPNVYVPKIYPFNPIFGGVPNGGILLIYRDTLLVYYPRNNVFLAAKNTIGFYEGFVYVESLVSPVLDKNHGTIC